MNKYIFVWSKCPLKALKSIQKAYKPFFSELRHFTYNRL